ncbi:hypothetical protein ACLKA7_013885 [Drosophila subpalustris]
MSQENPKKRKMDMSKASRGIWLVKVPNYVAKIWDKSPSDMQVATLRMESSMDAVEPAKVKLLLSDQVINLDPEKMITSEHELKLSKSARATQLTGIFSTVNDEEPAMEGWITHKMECHPVCNAQYFMMKQQSLKSIKQQRTAEPLNNIVKNFKPVSSHIHNREDSKRKKDAGCRSLSKEAIMELLFQAFEKHQYYSLKDLAFITKQSIFVLKTILKDIGDYSKNPAHKQMWELKEEYRHYQTPDSGKSK